MSADFTIVTGVTPDYLKKFKWAFHSWTLKPQFQNRPIVIFHHGFKDVEPRELNFIKSVYSDWTFVKWQMPKYDNQRELMLSSFILGVDYVKTSHYVKIDADAYFTTKDDVFSDKDFDMDLVSHKWRYTKPGWWIDALDCFFDKVEYKGVKDKAIRKGKRIQSICCLHKTDFVKEIKKRCGQRLPVPSHDTVAWYFAEKLGYKWHGKNLKRYGVGHTPKEKEIRENVCAIQPQHATMSDDLLKHVQIEITSHCNLACPNCDRNCGKIFGEHMTLSQIWRFVDEAIQLKHKFNRIDIIGGEPTMHPELLAILDIIKIYKNKYPRCKVRLSTNGVGEKVQDIIKILPKWVGVRNSNKSKGRAEFDDYHSSPKDRGEKTIKACSIPWRCGMALTNNGYFTCGAGASLAKIFNYDVGINSLIDFNSDVVTKQLNKLCEHCGHSFQKSKKATKTEDLTESWKKAFETYREGRLHAF